MGSKRQSYFGCFGESTLDSLKNRILGLSLLVLLVLLAHAPSLDGGFVWDDRGLLAAKKVLSSWEGLRAIWTGPVVILKEYYPLTHTMFWLEYHLWKFNPFPYHLHNLILHLANTLLVWAVLSKLRMPGAWLAAAVFGLHPVHVESVAWIAERKNVLSFFFYLLALLSSLRFQELPTRRFYFLALGLFVLSVLSKTVTCTLPVTLLILLAWKKGRVGQRDLYLLLPFFGVSLFASLASFRFEEINNVSKAIEFPWSFFERCLIAGQAFWFYLGKLLLPVHLMPIYPRWEIDAGNAGQQFALFSALTLLVGAWFLRKKMGTVPLIGLLFFVVTLFPMLGFFNIAFFSSSLVADHWQYHASIGLVALFMGALKRFLKIPDAIDLFRPSPRFLTPAILIMTLAVMTWQRSQLFADEEALWRDNIRQNPRAIHAHHNLAVALQRRGEWEEAKLHYLNALRLKTDDVVAYNASQGEGSQHRGAMAERLNAAVSPAEGGSASGGKTVSLRKT